MIPSKGQKIRIGKEEFDVIGAWQDYDISSKGELGPEHLRLELCKIGSRKLIQTHEIKIYESDHFKAFMKRINYKNPSKEVFPNRKLNSWEIVYSDEKTISTEDIEIIS